MTTEAHEVGREVAAALRSGGPLRRDLPGGRLFVDHAVPLLVVHRCRGGEGDPARGGAPACAESHDLVTAAPAYAVASGDDAATLAAVARSLAEACGRLLVVELWVPLGAEHGAGDADPFRRRPGFTLYAASDADAATQAAAAALCDALSGIEIAGQGADVSLVATPAVAPPGLPPLDVGDGRVSVVGLAVDAVFHNAREGEF